MKLYNAHVFIILVVLLIGLDILHPTVSPENKNDEEALTSKIKGVCWEAGDSVVSRNFDGLVEIGANWISQTPFVWQSKYNIPHLRMSTDRVLWGERDVGLRHTTALAKAKGLQVILKPHIWIRRSGGKWRGDIEMESEKEWSEWFENYEKIILHYAKLAQEEDIEALCIGTELYIASTRFPEKWRKIIRRIRSVYSGKLTYAANFYMEYEEIEFWDELDFIGVQGYFPLCKKAHPEINKLLRAWKRPKKKLKRISEKYGKPVVFTEIGYTNTAMSAHEPWTWPQQIPIDNIEYSDETQANCYEAMFRSFWSEPWFEGAFIWKWFHGGYAYTFEERTALRRSRLDSLIMAGRFRPRSLATFSPQGRVAENVLRNWYRDKP